MTALLRIAGCVWLALVVVSLVIVYGILWIWQVVMTATAAPPPSAPVSILTVVAIVIPGFIVLGLAAWLDRRR